METMPERTTHATIEELDRCFAGDPRQGPEELIRRLLGMPLAIHEAEDALIEAQARLEDAEWDLADREAQAHRTGELTGKNEETRRAQLREITAELRGDVRDRALFAADKRCRLHRTQNEFSMLKAIARLIGGSDEAR